MAAEAFMAEASAVASMAAVFTTVALAMRDTIRITAIAIPRSAMAACITSRCIIRTSVTTHR
jgi:hypothetical protein